jgi:heat shock protein HspQ
VSQVAKAANMTYVSVAMNKMRNAKYQLGQVVKHRL